MARPADSDRAADATAPIPSSQRNISFAVLEQVVRVVLGFAVSTKVARDVGPSQFADLAVGLALATLLLPLATFGSDAFLLQRLAEGESSDARWSRPATRVRILGTGLAIVAAVAATFFVVDGARSTTTVLLTVAILVTVPADLAFLRAIARHRLDRVAPWRVVILVTGAAARLGVLLLGGDVRAIAAVLLAETIGVSAVTWRLCRAPRAGASTAADRAKVVAASVPFLVAGVLYSVYLRIDMLIVRVVLGAEDLGTYSVAVRVSELGAVTSSLVIPSWAAAVAQTHRAGSVEFDRAYVDLVRRSVVLSLAIATLTAIGGWFAIEPVFGSQYRDARDLVAIHAFSMVPLWLLAVRERYLAARDLGGLQVGASLAGAVVAVVANLILLPTIGLSGAAWGTVLAYSVAAAWAVATRRQRAAFAPLVRAARPVGAARPPSAR